jgi:hypothetical protein
METPVLRSGGFWVCPTCGHRNKNWAPCPRCGTALAGMPGAGVEAAPATAPARGRARNWLLYAFMALGVATAVGVVVLLRHLLGGAALGFESEPNRPRAEITPMRPPPTPPLPEAALPQTPPTTLPAPFVPPLEPAPEVASSPPSPAMPPAEQSPRLIIRRVPPRETEASSRAVRERLEDLRAARERFAQAESELRRAGPDEEMQAMERLEQAARDLRRAESELDRARRRAGRS